MTPFLTNFDRLLDFSCGAALGLASAGVLFAVALYLVGTTVVVHHHYHTSEINDADEEASDDDYV